MEYDASMKAEWITDVVHIYLYVFGISLNMFLDIFYRLVFNQTQYYLTQFKNVVFVGLNTISNVFTVNGKLPR